MERTSKKYVPTKEQLVNIFRIAISRSAIYLFVYRYYARRQAILDLLQYVFHFFAPFFPFLFQNALNHDGDEKGTETCTRANEIREGADTDPSKSTWVCDSSEMVKGDRADKPVINTSSLLDGSGIQFWSGEKVDRLSESEDLNAVSVRMLHQSSKATQC